MKSPLLLVGPLQAVSLLLVLLAQRQLLALPVLQ